MFLILPFKVTKSQIDYAIRSETYDFLLVFYSNYSATSHGTLFLRQMTLIWPFKVTKGQTDCAIRSPTYDFLLVVYRTIASLVLMAQRLARRDWKSGGPRFKSHSRLTSQSWSSYQLNQLEVKPHQIRLKTVDYLRGIKYLYYFYFTLSHTETLFFSRYLDLTFQGHQKLNGLCHPIRVIWLPISVI